MGDESAAYYKSLFLGQAEKGEQTKKGISKRHKTTGSGPFSAKKVKKDILLPPPEDAAGVGVIATSTEVGDIIATSTKVGDVIATSTKVATTAEPKTPGEVPARVVAVTASLSPATSVDLLGSLVRSPST